MSHLFTQLTVKRNTLAAESKIIRRQELKWKRKAYTASRRQRTKAIEIAQGLRHDLYEHRRKVVRPEARKSHLAFAFLRGQSYYDVEQKVWNRNMHTTPYAFLSELVEIVYRFSDKQKTKTELLDDLKKWRQEHPGFAHSRIAIHTANEFYKYGDMFFSLKDSD